VDDWAGTVTAEGSAPIDFVVGAATGWVPIAFVGGVGATEVGVSGAEVGVGGADVRVGEGVGVGVGRVRQLVLAKTSAIATRPNTTARFKVPLSFSIPWILPIS
jgi:hypothetical protein